MDTVEKMNSKNVCGDTGSKIAFKPFKSSTQKNINEKTFTGNPKVLVIS